MGWCADIATIPLVAATLAIAHQNAVDKTLERGLVTNDISVFAVRENVKHIHEVGFFGEYSCR